MERKRISSRDEPRQEQTTTLKRDLQNFQQFVTMLSDRYEIDKNDLDANVKWQAEAVTRINDVYAHLVSLRDEAEAEIKVVKSEVDASIRLATSKDGGGKLTEDAIKQLIIRDRRTLAAEHRHNVLKRDVERISAAKASYKDRGFAIRMMVDLYVSGYFSDRVGVPKRQPYDRDERQRDYRR